MSLKSHCLPTPTPSPHDPVHPADSPRHPLGALSSLLFQPYCLPHSPARLVQNRLQERGTHHASWSPWSWGAKAKGRSSPALPIHVPSQPVTLLLIALSSWNNQKRTSLFCFCWLPSPLGPRFSIPSHASCVPPLRPLALPTAHKCAAHRPPLRQ